MNDLIADLWVIAAIVALCFVGAVEYVYWRFGVDKILDSLQHIEQHTLHAVGGRRIA